MSSFSQISGTPARRRTLCRLAIKPFYGAVGGCRGKDLALSGAQPRASPSAHVPLSRGAGRPAFWHLPRKPRNNPCMFLDTQVPLDRTPPRFRGVSSALAMRGCTHTAKLESRGIGHGGPSAVAASGVSTCLPAVHGNSLAFLPPHQRYATTLPRILERQRDTSQGPNFCLKPRDANFFAGSDEELTLGVAAGDSGAVGRFAPRCRRHFRDFPCPSASTGFVIQHGERRGVLWWVVLRKLEERGIVATAQQRRSAVWQKAQFCMAMIDYPTAACAGERREEAWRHIEEVFGWGTAISATSQ